MKQYIIKCLKEKAIRLLIATTALMLLSQVLYAQEDYVFYLQKARQRIAEGDCIRAEASYNTYKEMTNKTDNNLERQIQDCKSGTQSNTQNGSQICHFLSFLISFAFLKYEILSCDLRISVPRHNQSLSYSNSIIGSAGPFCPPVFPLKSTMRY